MSTAGWVVYGAAAVSAVVCLGAYALARLSEIERRLERDVDPESYPHLTEEP